MEQIPFDKRTGKIWFNNELVNWSDAKIHILSHGFHYASCVFEGLRVYDGQFQMNIFLKFFLDLHKSLYRHKIFAL